MKKGKTLFVAVCRVWSTGGTRDLLAVETEDRSQLGDMICKTLEGRARVEIGKDWLTNIVQSNLLREDDSKDALKEMDKFINDNLQVDLRVVIGEIGRSQEMPDGKSCLKVSCWYLHAGGGCLSKSIK